jgi:hypothetical protein
MASNAFNGTRGLRFADPRVRDFVRQLVVEGSRAYLPAARAQQTLREILIDFVEESQSSGID